MYTKVLAGDSNVRYLDKEGKWWHRKMNGKFTPSRPMEIKKIYGEVEISIIDDSPFGLRAAIKE